VRTYGASFVGQKWAVEVLNVSLQVQLRCLILEPLLTAAPCQGLRPEVPQVSGSL
jgi:hypothetical protein